jgi:di/tricarboxylate transporter
MTWFVLLTIVVLLIGLASGRVKAFYLFGGLAVIYYFLDLLSLESLLQNFVNPALVTLVLLLIISQALERTNWIEIFSKLLFVSSLKKTYFRMAGIVGISSAFLNNTAVVATLMSSVKSNSEHPSSKLLIPLSYFAILGGTLTLVGTSTNLIVNGFVIQAGLPSLGIFDFMYVGIPLLIIGTLVIVLFSSNLLPNIKETIKELKEYFVEAEINVGSILIGKTVEEAGLRRLGSVYLAQIIRDDNLISPVSPAEKFAVNDILMFTGSLRDSSKLLHLDGLRLCGETIKNPNQLLIEVVISHTSNLVGKTITETNFRSKFNAAVLAVHRGGKELLGGVSQLPLKAGDSLVLVAGADFYKHDNIEDNFYFYTDVGHNKVLNTVQSWFVGIGFFTVLLLASLDVVSLFKGLLLLLATLFVGRILRFQEVKQRFPFELMIVIGSALGIATVMIETGVANLLAESVLSIFSPWGVMGSLVGIYLFTLLLTELITNNASAAIGFPVAMAASEILGVSPWPFIMVIAYGASASFLTPYGYQTNLMVYTPGSYEFKHYFKAGFPLTIFYSITVLVTVPIFFPF